MRFDVIIIGGGLSGFTAGLRLLEAGKSCALVSAGQSALHFSSGSFDFLNYLPDGSFVSSPVDAMPELIRQSPGHPYALLGYDTTVRLAQEAEILLRSWGIEMQGTLAGGNHQRFTPLGKLSPTWLSTEDALCVNIQCGIEEPWPWRRGVLVGIEGFLDIQPEIVAASLEKLGMKVDCEYLRLPELEKRRKNSSEFRSINIARVFDHPDTLDRVADTLNQIGRQAEILLLPACIGLRDSTPVRHISERTGKPVKLIPTLPPSLLGARISQSLGKAFLDKGGVLMPGDRVVGHEFESGATLRISKLYTVNHEDIPLEMDHCILATGSFFSKGLIAEQQGIREQVFNLDLTNIPMPRDRWTGSHFFDPQPYAGFGIKSDASMNAYYGGEPVKNLYAAGMVLGNFDPVRQGCGAGVALTSALAAANAILEQ